MFCIIPPAPNRLCTIRDSALQPSKHAVLQLQQTLQQQQQQQRQSRLLAADNFAPQMSD